MAQTTPLGRRCDGPHREKASFALSDPLRSQTLGLLREIAGIRSGLTRIGRRADVQMVKRGEMTLEEYLDERAEVALAHVKGSVADDILEGVRQTLREKLRSDPVLLEAVRRATGQVPTSLPKGGQ